MTEPACLPVWLDICRWPWFVWVENYEFRVEEELIKTNYYRFWGGTGVDVGLVVGSSYNEVLLRRIYSEGLYCHSTTNSSHAQFEVLLPPFWIFTFNRKNHFRLLVGFNVEENCWYHKGIIYRPLLFSGRNETNCNTPASLYLYIVAYILVFPWFPEMLLLCHF